MKHLHLKWVVCSRRLPGPHCDALMRLGESFAVEEPTVVGPPGMQEHRVAEVRMVPDVPGALPLYQLLWDTAADATRRHYGLLLSGITRMPHYVVYRAGRGHFHWHDDYSHEADNSPRKLTVIIQLSDGSDYGGGDLEVFGEVVTAVPRERGTVVCLPSFIPHRVTPVTAGIRRVIVAWIAGPRLV